MNCKRFDKAHQSEKRRNYESCVFSTPCDSYPGAIHFRSVNFFGWPHGLAWPLVTLLWKTTVGNSLISFLLLAAPRAAMKTYGDHAFSVASPFVWRLLSLDLRRILLITNFNDQFLKLFKLHLENFSVQQRI